MLSQFQVGRDLGGDITGNRIRARRELEAGNQFLGDGDSADGRFALEHEHSPTGTAEVVGCNQTVGSGSDDDDIVVVAHRSFLRISSAANRPGPEVMPPPGCAPEPHW